MSSEPAWAIIRRTCLKKKKKFYGSLTESVEGSRTVGGSHWDAEGDSGCQALRGSKEDPPVVSMVHAIVLSQLHLLNSSALNSLFPHDLIYSHDHSHTSNPHIHDSHKLGVCGLTP